jgi:hypothetical protein
VIRVGAAKTGAAPAAPVLMKLINIYLISALMILPVELRVNGSALTISFFI